MVPGRSETVPLSVPLAHALAQAPVEGTIRPDRWFRNRAVALGTDEELAAAERFQPKY